MELPSLRKLGLTCALLALSSTFARADTFTIDAAHSRIAFSVRHLLGTARGEFHKFSGTIEVDPAQPERASVNVKILVASIDTGIRKRDDHLLSAEFFDAKKFPEIIFRSRSVKRFATDKGEIAGDFTMRGVTRLIKLQVKLVTPLVGGEIPARTRWLVTSGPLRRKDFGLMFSGTAEALSGIGLEVVPQIEIAAVRNE